MSLKDMIGEEPMELIVTEVKRSNLIETVLDMVALLLGPSVSEMHLGRSNNDVCEFEHILNEWYNEEKLDLNIITALQKLIEIFSDSRVDMPHVSVKLKFYQQPFIRTPSKLLRDWLDEFSFISPHSPMVKEKGKNKHQGKKKHGFPSSPSFGFFKIDNNKQYEALHFLLKSWPQNFENSISLTSRETKTTLLVWRELNIACISLKEKNLSN